MQQIRLGPAGSPILPTIKGVQFLKNHGLHFMEVAFTYSVYMSNEEAKKVGDLAKKLNIGLSCHGEYWINLSSKEKRKIEQSKKRILNAAEKLNYMQGERVVFHAGFYQNRDPEEVYQIIRDAILDLQKQIKNKKWKIKLAPETTGKASQFGNLDELIKLVKETKCSLCIDPAHLYAREGKGEINYKEMFDKLEKLKAKNLHFHFSGITYTKKGERMHINMNHHPDFRPFAKEILKRKINCSIVCESPITWRDSLKQKKIFENLDYKFT